MGSRRIRWGTVGGLISAACILMTACGGTEDGPHPLCVTRPDLCALPVTDAPEIHFIAQIAP